MKEQELFEALGQIDPKYIAAAQRHRGRAAAPAKQEYCVEPEREGSPLRWLAAVACVLAVALLVVVVPNLHRDGNLPLATQGATQDCIHVQMEPTAPIKEEQPPIYEPAPYVMEFESVEDYWRLREAVNLPDADLHSFLENNHYSQAGNGIDSRVRLEKFIEDTQYLPIPSFPGYTLKKITIEEYNADVIFEYSECTIEVAREPDAEYVRSNISQLELIWGYEGEYSLYLGSENALASVCYLDVLMNAQDYLVRISVETDDPVGFIDDLEQLSFRFPEIASVTPPVGVYGSTMDGFEWRFEEKTGILTFSPLREKARVDGYMIASEAPWCAHGEKITALVVEEGIVSLGNRSITNLPNLQKVSLPESLLSIGDRVFVGCAIQELRIPAGVTNIGMGVAADCADLRTVTVESWQPQIGQKFLQNCPALEKITMKSPTGYWRQVVLPANPHLAGISVDCAVEAEYDPTAQYDENGVLWSYQPETGSLSIQGSGVVALPPAGVLMVWGQVQTVTLSEGITAMAGGLADMVSLRAVSLPTTLEVMPSFSGCKNLEMVTVPERVKELPSMVFNGCAKLKTIILPDGLEKIENMAFGSCGALEYISIPDSVSWIGSSAFWACLSLKEIRLPESLRRLKDGTFMECVQLKTVTLPAGLADIEIHCFDGCTALKTLRFEGTQEQWDKLYSHCTEAIPEGVTVEVGVQPTEEPQPQKRGSFSLLWMVLPMAILAVVVTEIVIGKRKS